MSIICQKKSLIFLVCIFSIIHANAQITLKGKINNTKGTPMADLNVILSPAHELNKIITYTSSTQDGTFTLNYNPKEKRDSVTIRLTGFNISTYTKIIPNNSATYNLTVHEKAIRIKEVAVKAQKITQRGDTINYNIASFKSTGDLVIADVLKKLPGIEVRKTGEIKYNGKAISKLYIEGLDLLKGRYSIATNNLVANDVAAVQILENHQAIKALKGVDYPDRAALNLKLKSSVKSIFSLLSKLGTGYSDKLLWKNELFSTYFSRKRQFIATYKNNNVGFNLSNELYNFSGKNHYTNSLLNVSTPIPPNIAQESYFFNNAHSATVNYLSKNQKGLETTINIIYYNNHETRNSKEKTIYTFADATQKEIKEDKHAVTNINRLNSNLSFELNKKKTYIMNQFHLVTEWESASGDTQTDRNTHQHMKQHQYSISNLLHLIGRWGKHKGIDYTAKIHAENRPQNLYTDPFLLQSSFNLANADLLRQEVTRKSYGTNHAIHLL